jgi:hypothetical protein
LYAIDTTGKLVLGSNYMSEELNETVLDIEAVGTDYVLFMTTNSIFRTQPTYSTLGHARYYLEKLYEGTVMSMHAGSQHVFINTPNGYLVGGHNNYFQFGMPTPPPVADVFFFPATNVNNLGTIDKLVTGGWHAYAQRDKTFYGWGCNSVSMIFHCLTYRMGALATTRITTKKHLQKLIFSKIMGSYASRVAVGIQ